MRKSQCCVIWIYGRKWPYHPWTSACLQPLITRRQITHSSGQEHLFSLYDHHSAHTERVHIVADGAHPLSYIYAIEVGGTRSVTFNERGTIGNANKPFMFPPPMLHTSLSPMNYEWERMHTVTVNNILWVRTSHNESVYMGAEGAAPLASPKSDLMCLKL